MRRIECSAMALFGMMTDLDRLSPGRQRFDCAMFRLPRLFRSIRAAFRLLLECSDALSLPLDAIGFNLYRLPSCGID